MKIVVLDGYTLNPGDLNQDALTELGTVTVHDRTPPTLVPERAREAEILLTNKTVLSRDIIEALPQLRYIGVLATGFNVVDLEAANERGIPVTNVPAYSTDSVAQHVFALVFGLWQRVERHDASVRAGDWTACDDFCYWKSPLTELSGLTMGIVGLGRIGQRTAKLARAFGMRVVACGRQPVDGIDLDHLLRESDVVSLHCPLTPQTEKLINEETLGRMKSSAVLINTSRGPLINEPELADALNNERIAGAGLDVLSTEPPTADNPLLSARNCLITPHLAWATKASRERLLKIAVANVAAFLQGAPTNVVNG